MMFRGRKCNISCSCMFSCICGVDRQDNTEDDPDHDFRNIVNILLLGAAETGKSTLMRQMKIIHNGEMSPASLRSYKRDILANVLRCTNQLIKAVEQSGLSIDYIDPKKCGDALQASTWGLEPKDTMYPRIPHDQVQILANIWQDPVVQECWQRANEFNLPDSTAYYMSSLARISSDRYTPTQEDVLRMRLPTSETSVNDFTNGDWIFRITDIGGQRGSRRRWVRLFDGINAIIFLTALCEYDQFWSEEDGEEEGKNRLELSLEIFQEILRYRGFEKTSIIVFLNKADVLEERVKRSDLCTYFPDYTGPKQDAKSVTEYIKERFQSVARTENKNVYFHETCATDTQKTKFVFTAVRNDILWRHVREFVEPFSVME